MPLTLRISPFERLAPGQPAERTLVSGRLTIGRAADNDIVLADPERVVSKHHCLIEGSRDSFRLADTSVNGVYVNAEPEPVGRGRSHQLRDGDRLRIGAYEITVELAAAPAFGIEAPAEPLAEAAPEVPLGAFSSVTELFADESPAAADRRRPPPSPVEPRGKPARLADLERGVPIDEAFFPPRGRTPPAPEAEPAPKPAVVPAARSGAPVIPTDWERPAAAAPTPAPKPAAPAADIPEEWWSPPAKAEAAAPLPAAPASDRSPAPSSALPPAPAPMPESVVASAPEQRTAPSAAAFLRGAGLDPGAAGLEPPEVLLTRAGAVLRLVVEGVITLLEARRAVKGSFRLDTTQFKATENNPLKFSADAEAALVSLLGSPRRGYLDAETAFAEAFADLRGHEMALLAGMQEVWRHLIGRFDPKALEARVGEDSGLGGLIGSKKARCWDAFVTLYETLAGGADDDLRLVERIFAEAYDSHIDRQRQDGRGSRE